MSDTDSTQLSGAQDANLVASPAGVQPNSSDQEQLAAKLESQIIERLISNPRLLQSLTDKTLSSVEKNKTFKGYKAYRDEVAALKAQGYTEREIEQEFRFREIEAEKSAPVARGSATDSGTSELEALLPALGLAADDPDVLRVSASPLGLGAKAAALVQIAQRKNTPPNPAAVSQPPSAPPPKNDVSAMVARYAELAKSPTKNAAAMATLKAKLDAENWGQ